MKSLLTKGLSAVISAFIAAIGLQLNSNLSAPLNGDWAAVYFIYALAVYVAAGIPVSYLLDWAAKKLGWLLKLLLYVTAGAFLFTAFFRFSGAWQLPVLGGLAAGLFLGVETIIKKRRHVSS